jgi:hypothetical protein
MGDDVGKGHLFHARKKVFRALVSNKRDRFRSVPGRHLPFTRPGSSKQRLLPLVVVNGVR